MRDAAREILATLEKREDPSPLAPKRSRDAALDRKIEALVAGDAPDAERAVQSALFLWNDNLTRAHEVAQEIKDTTGSYLHGIMHRREPDYGNSKYWFRRVGKHPAFPAVRRAALELLGDGDDALAALRRAVAGEREWNALRMVDWCEASDRGASPPRVTAFLEALQAREIAGIAHWCLDRVTPA